jgi:hypothetical protein
MALGKFIGDNLKGGLKDSVSLGTAGSAFAIFDLARIAQAKSKLLETLRVIKDMAIVRFTWPLALVGMLRAGQTLIRGIVRDTGSLEAAMRRISQMRALTTLFSNLMRDTQMATRHVAELMRFSSRSPFNISQVGAASKSFELMGKGVYGSLEAMQVFGDVAAKTGNSIEEVSSAASVFFSEATKGESISATVEEMRQMGIITSDNARHFVQMQKDGASATAMISAMQSALAASRGGMEEHAGDIGVVSKQYEAAKEGMKAGFGNEFVKNETDAMQAWTKVLIMLTPFLTALGKQLSDIAGFASNLAVRFTAWISSFSKMPIVMAFAGTALGHFIKLLAALAVAGTLRSFSALFNGASQFSNVLREVNQNISEMISRISTVGKSAANAMGASRMAGWGASMSQAGQSKMMFAKGIYQPSGTGQLMLEDKGPKLADMQGKLNSIKASAMAAGLSMRGLGMAVEFTAVAFRALMAATLFLLALQVVIAIVQGLFAAISDLATGFSAGKDAAAKMREEFEATDSAMRRQIATVQTFADKIEAMTAANNEAAEAQRKYQELLAKGSAIGNLTYGIIGNRKASTAEVHEARAELARAKANQVAASLTPTDETEAQRAQRMSQYHRERMEKEASYEARMSVSGPGGQLLTREHKIASIQAETDTGEKAIKARADFAKTEQDRMMRIKEIEGKQADQRSQHHNDRADAMDESIAREKAELIRDQQAQSKGGSLRAEGNIAAIDAALKLRELQGTKGAAQKDIYAASQAAGGYAGRSKEELIKSHDEERTKRDKAKEIEDSYGDNTKRLATMKNEQIEAILKASSGPVSSLARIGGGGNVGESPMISIARRSEVLLQKILDVQIAINKAPPGETGDLFGTF